MTDQEKFKNEVERRFRKLFRALKDGYKLPAIERDRLAGFIQAGVFMGLSSNGEMQDLMEHVHLSVFGKTITERKQSELVCWHDESQDFSEYESPTFLRQSIDTSGQ